MTTRTPYSRLAHSGTAPDTTLAVGVDNSTLTVALTDGTGWPDGTGGPFIVTFEPGTSSEEKTIALSRSGNTLTLSQRGFEGPATAHNASAVARHSFSATEADENNYTTSQTVGLVAAKGDVLYGAAANQLARLAKGSANQSPMWDSTGALVAGNPAPGAHVHTESDVTFLVDDLGALQDAPASGWSKGALLVGKADGTADTLPSVPGGVVYAEADGTLAFLTPAADGSVVTLSGGVPVYAASPSGVLGSTAYTGSVSVPTSRAALDTTHLTLTFLAPASGKVLVRAAFLAQVNGFTSIGWYTHSTTTGVGTDQSVTPTSAGVVARQTVEQTLTGLTAGQSYTLDLTGHGTSSGGAISDTVLTAWAA